MAKKLKEKTLLKRLISSITDAPVLLALIPALLFLIGSTWISGYNQFWGVNSNLVPNSFQNSIHLGFEVLRAKTTLWLFVFFTIYFVIHLILTFLINLGFKHKEKVKKFVEYKENADVRESAHKKIISITEKIYLYFGLIVILLIGFSFFKESFVELGYQRASEIRAIYQDSTSNDKIKRNLMVKNGERFHLFGCNDFSCTIYIPESDKIKVISQEWVIGSSKKIPIVKFENLDKSGNKY